MFPTLPTLLRIAMVFGVGLEFFFNNDHKHRVLAVMRKRDRVRVPERPGLQDVPYYCESLDDPATERKLSAYVAEFQDVSPEKSKPHSHPGAEFLFVIKGFLILKVGSEEFTLEAEDSIYFDSAVPHSYRRRGIKPCSAIIVTAP